MNLELLAERIAKEVVNRINESECATECKRDDSEKTEKVLFIVPRQAINLSACLETAFAMFSGANMLLLISGCAAHALKYRENAAIGKLDDEKLKESVIEDFSSFSGVCLISPGIKLLEDIINTDDTGFIQYIMINSLVYGKNTRIITDIGYDKQPAGSLFEKIKNIFGQISAMGIDIKFSSSNNDRSYNKKDIGRQLITEKDVIATAKSGVKEIICEKGCIITPLAFDKARESGIIILFKED